MAEACRAGSNEVLEQRFDVAANDLVAAREIHDRGCTLMLGARQHLEPHPVELLPAVGCHASVESPARPFWPESALKSHPRAASHSRSIVRGDTRSTWLASSSVSPAKNRSSAIRLLRASNT